MQLTKLLLTLSLLAIPAPALANRASATYYGPGFHGRTMANGQRFNQWAMTAAHPRYRFGTRLRVSYGGRSVVVTITDRCPRCGLDLSKGAFQRLAPLSRGRINVRYQRL